MRASQLLTSKEKNNNQMHERLAPCLKRCFYLKSYVNFKTKNPSLGNFILKTLVFNYMVLIQPLLLFYIVKFHLFCEWGKSRIIRDSLKQGWPFNFFFSGFFQRLFRSFSRTNHFFPIH